MEMLAILNAERGDVSAMQFQVSILLLRMVLPLIVVLSRN